MGTKETPQPEHQMALSETEVPPRSGLTRRSFFEAGLATVAMAGMAGCNDTGSQGVDDPSGDSPTVARQTMRTRKNAKDLTAQEKADFVAAILKMKEVQSPFLPGLSYYDSIVSLHAGAVKDAAFRGYGHGHKSPAFFPFHRKLVLLLEDGLQEVSNKEITVPYWDWADPTSTDIVFSDDFLGPKMGDPAQNYAVTTGPFNKDAFPLHIVTTPIGDGDHLNQCPFPFLTRGPKNESNETSPNPAFGNAPLVLPTAEEVEAALAIETYDVAPYDATAATLTEDPAKTPVSFRNHLEGNWTTGAGLHNRVHAWIAGSWVPAPAPWRYSGLTRSWSQISTAPTTDVPDPDLPFYVGTMLALQTSTNDPAFFLHHSNVDRLWDEWMKRHPDAAPYLPESGERQGWNIDDELYPFSLYKSKAAMVASGLTPRSLTNIETLGYQYQ